ncbi:hypothetical protein [Scytonema hofmannii]|uniref:hypothetical protein n=1 Tax=Scytonema hofmannii TaxID=34078 RepID=UPI0008378864|nr:hypothetical protein [Scytonema hofmannii]
MLYTTKVRKWLLHSLLVIGLSLSELCGGIVGKTVLLAEITPDTSLGNESSQLIKGVEVKGH